MKTNAKNYSNATAATLLITMILFVLPACVNTFEIEPDTHSVPNISFTAGPDGGYFNALDGNVELYFPPTVLTEKVRFSIEEGSDDEEGDFVIKSILVDPLIQEFKEPVSIKLRYDGCLANGQDPCKAKSLALYYFKDDKAFDARRPEDMIWIEKCYLNTMDQSIETNIHRGGVYAIGEASMDTTKD